MTDDLHRPEAGYIRRLDPDWVSMVRDVGDAKENIKLLIDSNHRQERYLVGGWSEDGSKWIIGVREKIDNVEKFVRWFWAIAAGVWVIAAALVVEALKGLRVF